MGKIVKIRNKLITVTCAGMIAISGCASNGKMSNLQKGALIGAASGAAVGLLAKDKKKGALIGAVGGGIAGAAVGNYMDQQKADLEKVLKDERGSGAITVEKDENDILFVRMTSQTSFATGSTDIQSGFESTMNKIADVVTKYQKTELQVIGHTDSQGSETSNQTLSEKRAKAVADYLAGKGVIDERLAWLGKGETNPITTNDTIEGRSSNRRVEIIVVPIVDESAKAEEELS